MFAPNLDNQDGPGEGSVPDGPTVRYAKPVGDRRDLCSQGLSGEVLGRIRGVSGAQYGAAVALQGCHSASNFDPSLGVVSY